MIKKSRVSVTSKDVQTTLLVLSDAVSLYQKEKDNDLAPDYVMRRLAYDEMIRSNEVAKIVLEKLREK